MERLPPRSRTQLDEAGQALWDEIVATRGEQIVGEDGGLRGPFNAWVQSPSIGSKLFSVAGTLRYDASLDRHLIELAILTVGSHYHAEFEWWAHCQMARRYGVGEDVIAALAEGREPVLGDDTQRAVHLVTSELVSTGSLSEATYTAARRHLDDGQLVELVILSGYYALVSFTLNAFDVGLPAGVERQWPARA